MIRVCFLWFCFTLSSSLRIFNQRTDCTQPGLDNCRIGDCSKPLTADKQNAPTGPEWDIKSMNFFLDKDQFIPILNVSWRIKPSADIWVLSGSRIHIRDERSNETMCFEYLYSLPKAVNPDYNRWTFTFDTLVVQPENTYEVSVYNIPEPTVGNYRLVKKITIPGCNDKIIKHSQRCRENGSLWEPRVMMSTDPPLDKIQKQMFIVVSFYTSEYSEKYDVSLQSPGVFFSSETVSKENRTLLNVTFALRAPLCKIVIKIQPFFKQCNNNCSSAEKSFNCCEPEYVPQSADNNPCTQMAKRKRLLIIYSLDHPLYKNIVLKLCSFLMAKCGTEVVLDMLDSTRLGMVGGLQWLQWHKQQIEKSSDKILILCSRGVQAKWSAMCTGKQVHLREDVHSTVGDMLIPAFCLMVPEFVKSPSFEKYIVAYFDSVSTEDDVPSPFNMTVRYKLMKQFEELFFRILGSEKHEMGRVNRIEGLSEVDYHLCPTGGALRKAIEDFQAYQMEHPHWFEEELIENAEMDIDSDLGSVCQNKARQIVNDLTSEAPTILISEQREHLSLKM
ncbi:interleukin-17 receptor A isoform X2 [Boleophthalmus pectinirostris]|uniref:interleukin-17 receptor A isoform X2 n=1 Tax=Boleophthalmus pectinirostris TaxID=150288 RepID=UPI00242AF6A8|nr:interleukin-17 receptor A isoform X2 [Boleophthalmus pectinirostris]